MKADIVVIGGGASGLAAAISAKETAPNADVVIAERLDKVGRKLLATGSGRCNLGNANINAGNYHGSFNVMNVIGQTPASSDFMRELGVLSVSDSEGRLYPRSNSTATVLNALRLRASQLGVKEVCNFEVLEIIGKNGAYELRSGNDTINAQRVIVCAGGYASPQYGTDGKMLGLLRKNGYKIAKITPADAPLRVAPESIKGLKGVRVKGRIAAFSDGKFLAAETGEIQFTENSISGICVFNLAYLFSKYEGKLTLTADLLPDMDEKETAAYLKSTKKKRSHLPCEELLTGIFSRNLALYLIKRILNRPLSDSISDVSATELEKLASAVKSLDFTVTGCSSWQNAQVTSGGIHSDCVDAKLASKKDKGIYFAGEILDVDGVCGGYNLQWAWSSGILAGRNCAGSLIGELK